MLALYEVADRMAADPEDTKHTVLWCARSEDRRGNVSTRLYAAPLAVNGLIRTHLLAGRSGVLTSATLELGGSFDPIARAVGLEVQPDATAVGPASIDQDAPRAAVVRAVARARRRAARSTTRSRGSSTSPGTCRRPVGSRRRRRSSTRSPSW